MILALDVSLSTGSAFGSEKTRAPRSFVYELPHGTAKFDDALRMLRSNVRELCRAHGVTDLVIEKCLMKVDRWHSAESLFILASLGAVAREAARAHGARVHPIPIKMWRSTFLGNGNLSTEDAKAGALKRCAQLGWPCTNHNAAEAMGLFYHFMAERYPKWQPGKAA